MPDTPLADEPPDEQAPEGQVVTVQLPAAARQQQAFLRKVQDPLGTAATMGSLTPGPSADVFIIPGHARATTGSPATRATAPASARRSRAI